MKSPEAQLTRIVNRLEHLKQYNLSIETEREQALRESEDVLGALALYRGILKNAIYTTGGNKEVLL